MTGHDSETTSCHPTENRGEPRHAAPDVALKVLAGVAEQGLHGRAAVVAGDVRVEVLPDALDGVGVGTVGRKEVEDDAAAELREDTARRVGRVDAVGVDEEVDSLHPRVVAAGEESQEIAEQRGGLSRGA